MSLIDNGKYSFKWKHLTLSDNWNKGKQLQTAESQKWSILNNLSRLDQVPCRYFKAMSKFANLAKKNDRSGQFRASDYYAPACETRGRLSSVSAVSGAEKFVSKSPGNRSASVTFEDGRGRSAHGRHKSPSNASTSRSSCSSKLVNKDKSGKKSAVSTAAPPCSRTASAAVAMSAGVKWGSSLVRSPGALNVSRVSPIGRDAGQSSSKSPSVNAALSESKYYTAKVPSTDKYSSASLPLTDKYSCATMPISDVKSSSAIAALRNGITTPVFFKSHASTNAHTKSASSCATTSLPSVTTASPNPAYLRNLQVPGYLPPVSYAYTSSGDSVCRSDDLRLSENGSQSSRCLAAQSSKEATPFHVTPTLPVIPANQLTPLQKPFDMNVSKSIPRCDAMYLSMYRLGSNQMKPDNSRCGSNDQQFQLGYFPSGAVSSNKAFRSAWVETPSVSTIVYSESIETCSRWSSAPLMANDSDKAPHRTDSKVRGGAKVNDTMNQQSAETGSSKNEPSGDCFQQGHERSEVEGDLTLPSTQPANNELQLSTSVKKFSNRPISARKKRNSVVQSSVLTSLPRITNSLPLGSPRFSNTNNAALTNVGVAPPLPPPPRGTTLAPIINAAQIHANDSALLKLKSGGVNSRNVNKSVKDKSPRGNQKHGTDETKRATHSQSHIGEPRVFSEEIQKPFMSEHDMGVNSERKCQPDVATSHGQGSSKKTAAKPNSAKRRRQRPRTYKVRVSTHGDSSKPAVTSCQLNGARFPAGRDSQSKKPASSGKRFPNGKKCRKAQHRANSKQSQKQQLSSSESKMSIDTADEERLLRAKWAELKFLPSVNKLTEIPKGNDEKSGKKQKRRKVKQNNRSRSGGNKKKSGNKSRKKRVRPKRVLNKK